jgi:transcriptional regulator with XRE-family HTH domain
MTTDDTLPTRRRIRHQRGLALADAAHYVGVSIAKFTELSADGRMPKPKRIDDIRRWDVELLDIYFSQLPDDTRTTAERAPTARRAGVALRRASSISST